VRAPISEVQEVKKRLMLCGFAALSASAALVAAAGQSGPAAHSGARSSQGYFGIDVRDINDDELTQLKLKDTRGAEIIRVDHDGPAGKMGLREHDVVVQMNGATIDGEEQIRRMLHETAPGRTVALVICRDGQQITLTALMADKSEIERQAWEHHLAAAPPLPPPGFSSDPAAPPTLTTQPPATTAPPAKLSRGFINTILMSPSYTGILLERLGPQLAQFFGVPRGSGVLVKSVDNNSPAAVAGMKAGDVLLRANARPVVSMTDWTKAVRLAKGSPVTVVILRDHQEKTLTVTPDPRKRG
jgi:S1-C subfamily serine protease